MSAPSSAPRTARSIVAVIAVSRSDMAFLLALADPVQSAYVTLKAALAKAVVWRLIPANPMDAIKRPADARSKRNVWNR